VDVLRRRKWAVVVVAVLGLAVVAASVAIAESRTAARHTAFTPVGFEGNRAFAMDRLADVASHADAIVLGTPVAEEEIEDSEVFERGEGLLSRRLTVRIDRTLWLRRGTPEPALTIQTGGGSWSYKAGIRTPFLVVGEVGSQYVFVLGYNDDPLDTNGYQWGHEASLAVPILGGRTPTVINSQKPYFTAIRDKTPDELAGLFASTLGRGG